MTVVPVRYTFKDQNDYYPNNESIHKRKYNIVLIRWEIKFDTMYNHGRMYSTRSSTLKP